ncbi:hypothetical protein [Asanoa siamensis]|uniref:Uncharacterized protein n=1 Tax=Asanoa siamensis TaxID=926357 RepID=A0ABQ4CPG8_9ACTN|nr:hypothetical protein [Asanoa siamensis]GIF72742.1 hypothetical protein Asi02nite_22600 [Asanoa siamensis]
MDRTGKAALWVVAGHAALFGVAWLATLTQPSQVADGQCEGLGFGCTLSPRDGARFALFLFGAPALLVSLLLCLIVIAVVAARRTRRRDAAGLPPRGERTFAPPIDLR